jgi:serine/threonine protein kinase
MSIKVKQHDYTAFFKSLLTIFKGLTLLHESNLVHLDIKPYNLVSKMNADGTFSTRIIDFGMLTETKLFDIHPQDGAFSKEHDLFQGVFDQLYSYWPLELYLVTDTAFKNKSYNATIKKIAEFKDLLAESLLDDEEIADIDAKNEIQVVYPRHVYLDQLQSNPYMVQKLLNTIIIQLNNPNDILYKPSTVVKSVDVYALGITLGQIYSILSDHIYSMDGSIISINLIGDKEYDDEVIKERVSKPLFQLVSDMTDPVYENRITIQEATKRYMDLMPYFAYFTSTRKNTMANRTGSSILMHQKGSRSLPVIPNNQRSLSTIEENAGTLRGINLNSNDDEYNLMSPHPFGIEERNDRFQLERNPMFYPSTVRKTRARKNITRKRK